MARKTSKPAPGAPMLMDEGSAQTSLDPAGAKLVTDKKKWREKTATSLGGYARTRNVRDESVIAAMLEGIFTDLEKAGRIGDTDKAFQMIAHEVWKYFNDHPQSASLPKCAKDVVSEVEQWIRGHYGLDKNLVQMILRRSNVGMFEIDLLSWIANVHSNAEQMAFNKEGTYNKHWFNGTQASAFLVRFHRACDERAIPYAARSRFVNEAIGKDSIFQFEGGLQDLEALLAPKFAAVPVKVKPDVKTESVYTEKHDDDAEDLDEWFPREKKDNEAVSDKPSKRTRNWTRIWSQIDGLWNLYQVAVEDDMRAIVLDILGVVSPTDVDEKIGDADLMTTIKTGLDQRYKFKETVIQQESKPMTPLTQQEWIAWRGANYPNLDFTKDIIPVLHAWQVSEQGADHPVERLGHWMYDLETAGRAMQWSLSIEPEPSASKAANTGVHVNERDVTEPDPAPPLNLDFTMISQPVRVAPSARGNLVYKGYRFWFELGVGGTMQMVKSLIDEILKDADLIDPGCVVNPQIPVTDSSKLPGAQPQPVTAANAGIAQTPGADSENCYAIMKTMDVKGEKLVYNLLFKLANGADPVSPIQISTPRAKEMLESTLEAAGYKVDELPMNKRVDMNIYFERVKSGKYWDYIKFVILPESM